jgi:hypothetical protein
MRRIVVLMTVVALMVGMLAMSVAPAFAAWDAEGGQCRTNGHLTTVQGPYDQSKDRNGDGWIRVTLKGPNLTYFAYDTRFPVI